VDTLRANLLVLVITAILFSAAAHAQVERSGGSNAALMQQYQQVVSERTQLQADNEKLKKDNEDLKKQLAAATQQVANSKAGIQREQAALAAAQQSGDSNAKSLADTKARMQELIAKFRETLTTLRGVETDRTNLQQQVTRGQAAFDKCAERNYQLYQVSNEILDRYAHQGMFSYLARAEPFTQIKRTELDNLVLEYRERAQELLIKKADSAGAGAPAGATPAGGATPSPPSPALPAPPAGTSSPSAAPGSGAPDSAPPPSGAHSSG
jgi:cell division septum initiation protein DivIVA